MIIMGQLLLYDWTVAKIILTAILTGMIGIHFMNYMGIVNLHPKSGSVGSTVIGGLIFGAGFGMLGYCPGTMTGAVGQGSMDALLGGVLGMLIGVGLFARMYPWLSRHVLKAGDFGELTIPKALGKSQWKVIWIMTAGITAILAILETAGL